jgi:hypothetical protein
MEKFWRWLFNYAKKQVKEHYLGRMYHDRLCSNCKTWISETDGCQDFKQQDDFQFMTCKKCGYVSTWRDLGIVVQSLDD